MYNINNVTPEEHNCVQLQLYFKTIIQIQTIWNTEQGKIGEQWKKKELWSNIMIKKPENKHNTF